MKKLFINLTCLTLLFAACQSRSRNDLAKLTLTEKAVNLISFDDHYSGGVNTVDAPRAFALQASHSSFFSFNGQPLDSVGIIFFLHSEKIRKDSSLYQGNATVDQDHIANEADLKQAIKKFQAVDAIYGYRLNLKKEDLLALILKELTTLYGPGIKNPNTEHGLYWDLKDQHRLMFFNPDYRNLLVVDNSQLSKTCYADFSTGLIDLGGCKIEEYKAELKK